MLHHVSSQISNTPEYSFVSSVVLVSPSYTHITRQQEGGGMGGFLQPNWPNWSHKTMCLFYPGEESNVREFFIVKINSNVQYMELSPFSSFYEIKPTWWHLQARSISARCPPYRTPVINQINKILDITCKSIISWTRLLDL